MSDPTFRVCLDLNVWFSYFMAVSKKHDSKIRKLVELIVNDRSPLGPIQIVMSVSMLNRFERVLSRRFPGAQAQEHLVNLKLLLAENHPLHLILGSGVEPTRDAVRNFPEYDPDNPRSKPAPPYDPEDGRVLDAAIAGNADVIATSNFRDFWYHQSVVIEWKKIIVRKTAGRDITIIRPDLLLPWLRTGVSPVPPAPVAEQADEDEPGAGFRMK